DRHEALLAPAKVRVQARVCHGRGAEESPSVPIWIGVRDLVPGDVTLSGRLRFDYDRLAPNLGKLVGNDACRDVDDSSRGIGQDYVDAPARKVGLRVRSR